MVVGIIGILAAVGIPAYQKYQDRAELGVVQSTVNQVRKAFQTCMSVNAEATCQTANVDGTIEVSGDVTLSPASPGTDQTCWLITKGDFTGCVGFDGRNFKNQEFGFPARSSCSSVVPSCSSGTIGCPSGCSVTVKDDADTCSGSTKTQEGDADTCGTGTTTSTTTARCGTGVCSAS